MVKKAVACGHCKSLFYLETKEINRRRKSNKSGLLFCSVSCSSKYSWCHSQLDKRTTEEEKEERRQKYQREYQPQWYAKNRDKHIANVSRNRRRTKEEVYTWIRQYKEGHPCSCGEGDPDCLIFHHTDETKKKFSIAAGAGEGMSLRKIREEVDKCIVMCANCHRKLHAKIRRQGE